MYNLAIADKIYSSWSLRGWLMFKKFDIPVNIETARMKSDGFSKMLAEFGGGSTVPAIRIDMENPVFVTDSLAIAETLAERHPDLYMWPKTPAPRGQARSIVAEMHSGFTALRGACPMNLRHVYKGFAPSEPIKNDVTRFEKIVHASREEHGDNGPWLFGEYSLADVFYAPLATRLLTYQLPVDDVTQSYIQTVISDPDFKEWRQDGLAENYIQPGYDLNLPTQQWPEFD